MNKTGKYIYGIIYTQKPCELRVTNEYPGLHFVTHQDISALVRDDEIVDYTSMTDKYTVARFLLEHQKVIEKIMELGYSIIPMKLGTFCQDETGVKHILKNGYHLIKEIFHKITGFIEIDVVVIWSDLSIGIKQASEHKEIKEFKEKLLSNPKGITIDDQMKIGVMLKKILEQINEDYALKIQNALKTISSDIRAHSLMDDKMVMNTAFLLSRAREKEFYEEIEKLNKTFSEKLKFRCVGPLPPYSFYTLEVKKMQFDIVNQAREKLGILNEITTRDEIKKAYHRQTFVFHPDKNPDKLGIEKEFDEITRSYQTMLDYVQLCEQQGKQVLNFSEDEFEKNALLVKVM